MTALFGFQLPDQSVPFKIRQMFEQIGSALLFADIEPADHDFAQLVQIERLDEEPPDFGGYGIEPVTVTFADIQGDNLFVDVRFQQVLGSNILNRHEGGLAGIGFATNMVSAVCMRRLPRYFDIVKASGHRPWKDYARFVEAGAALLLAKLIVALAPFRAIASLASWRGSGARQVDENGEMSNAVVTAIRRASRRLSMRFVCFHEGLATHLMLRRRGVPSLLHYGVRQSRDRLTAHVWVTLNGAILIGHEGDEGRHTRVATFPDENS